MMGDLSYAKNANMHVCKMQICMYGGVNGNSRAALRKYHAQFPDRRMPNHSIFQRIHRQLRKERLFHVTRHDAGRRRAVRSPSLKESILNVEADRPKSSRAVVSHQTF
ncbi:uncharacterized protein TNCV_4498711 [Trichonephila clavipes]|nr:uncharacterized protein TNCV_4498711 [Trichonephila clavipes]